MNSVTPKAVAKWELLLNKTASEGPNQKFLNNQ